VAAPGFVVQTETRVRVAGASSAGEVL
jgi:hypothetical protein